MNQSNLVFRYIFRAPFCVLLVMLIYMAIFAKRGALDLHRMIEETENLKEKITEARLQRASLEKRIEILRKNPSEQERVVRQVLGYVKPSEIVIEFD